ncbi:hypothetical protein AWV79_24255 [Cupriavidus sp. UYMMa02A]|nr:hypothetical protein AWV79_24255 [Cupriavidus sp. UYMMa02A]
MQAIGLNPSANALWTNKPALTEALGLEVEWLDTVMPANGDRVGLCDSFFSRSRSDPFCLNVCPIAFICGTPGAIVSLLPAPSMEAS